MADITGNQTVRLRMPVGTTAEIDVAKKKGVFGFDTTAGTVAVCPADAANFVRLGLHPADAPAATSLNGADLVLIVQGGVLKRTTVADIGGGGVWQPLDSDLTAIAALTTTSFGRSLLTMANAAAVRSAIGAASTADLSGYQPLDSDLTEIAALTTDAFGRGLLPLSSAAAVRSYIGAGTVVPGDLAAYQPLDSDLTEIAALTTTAFGRSLLELVDGAAVRSAIGAGTSSFSGAYSALSGIPASIDAIDGLTPAADRLPYYTGASTGALATLTSFARTLLDDADASTARTTLGAAASTHDHTSITGSAAKLTTARSIAATGDAAWSVSFDGSAAVSAVLTLASTITAAGPVGSATRVPIITYDAKGRLTAVTDALITPAWTSVTGKPTTLSGYGIAATDVTAQALTGFVAGSNTAILATDSILAAFQKAQGQISARALASDVAAGYLPINNPTFMGILAGPRASLAEFGVLRDRTSNPAHGALYPTGVTPGTSNYAMLIYDDGTITALQASSSVSLAIGAATKLTATASAVDIGASTALQMNGTEVIDPSRNGIFAGLTTSGIFKAQTIVDASSFQWTPAANERPSFFGSPSSANDGSGYHSIVVHSNDSEATGRNLGYLKFGQKVSGKSGDGPGIKATINAETWGSGGSVGGFGGRLVLAARADNASALTNIASFDTTKVTIATGIPLYQGATERITTTGDGRFASLRASGLAAATVRPATIDTDGTLGAQTAAAFRSTIEAMAAPVTITGAIDFNNINGGAAGFYRLAGSSYTNAPGGATATTTYALWQDVIGGRITQLVIDGWYGGTLHREQLGSAGNSWSLWAENWDSTVVPISSFMKSVLDDASASSARATLGAAAVATMSDKNGNWSLDTSTTAGIRQTATGTLTLPAASATYAAKSYVITASAALTLTISGTFCYLDSVVSASYWYDVTSGTKGLAMDGGHGSGNRKKIEIWCDGTEWLVRC